MKDGHDIIGLGLESSCDETAAAVVKNGTTILSNIISSQIDLHREYCGVVPEIASRAHLETINGIIDRAMEEAGVTFGNLHYVAATSRPGLVGSLLIALQSAKAISYVCDIPLIGVHHLQAHLYAPFLEGHEPVFPYIGLLVSGGNTALFMVRDFDDYESIGRTVDDAVGEAFDKIAKFLDLGYPGGPIIEKLAATATVKGITFPRLLPDRGDFRFSYSGLKTAVIQYMKRHPDAPREEVAYGFQEAALELLVRRVFEVSRETGVPRIVVAGGVASNGRLRRMLNDGRRREERIVVPSPLLCTDNAAMVAGIGYRFHQAGRHDSCSLDVCARG
ncbi:MAG: tRNA (adenosine(37)-N6)-threonylcarbamoyltransferase complex transferase subunit TsaD [Spirochaetes bacterium]|nr:tRNA (adenosine(37)-N6)-threonylcarbamoyltransferase complex transferase subunit TsaD [Spirochaetota bacterium]